MDEARRSQLQQLQVRSMRSETHPSREKEISKPRSLNHLFRSISILQEELVALKASYPDLKLKKTPPSVPGAPFPITVTATIEAPPEASYIDVDSVQIKATIGILSTPDSPPSGNENSTLHGGGESFSTAVEIEGDTLPIKLKEAILSELDNVKSNPTDQSIFCVLYQIAWRGTKVSMQQVVQYDG
jgi:hypothetical protein